MSDKDTCEHEGLLISGDPPTLYCESCDTLWIQDTEIARLTKANAELREAAENVPRWQAGYTAYKCLGCGYEYPLTYDTASLNALHGKDCWVDRIERALANSSEGEAITDDMHQARHNW